MPTRPKSYKPAHHAAMVRQRERERGTADQRGYTWAWRKPGGIAEQTRRREPLCRMCKAEGVLEPTTQADHIVPLQDGGDNSDENLQGLCDRHNQSKRGDDARKRKLRNES